MTPKVGKVRRVHGKKRITKNKPKRYKNIYTFSACILTVPLVKF